MSGAVPAAVARRAVEWMVELQADVVADEVRFEWERWRAADPDHERAWQRIEAVNDRLRALGAPHAASAALLAPRGSGRRRQAVKALAVTLFAGGTAWLAHEQTPWRSWTADERTAVGARRALALRDGTRVALNTGSALDVHYGPGERRLRMAAGEILVTTARDAAQRPFIVDTRHGSVQALGTRFAVRLHDAATQVSVFAGAVELSPRGGAGSRVLHAGQQAWFGDETIAPVQAVDEDSVAWIDGYLIARSQRLRDFLRELGRYSAFALDCAPAVADLLVSGSYRLDDVRRVLDTVAATLGLEVETVQSLFGRGVRRVSLGPRRS